MTASNVAPIPRQPVDPEAEVAEAAETLANLTGAVIESQDDYALVGEVLSQANHKFKFLEEERKIAVAAANAEVKRVNDWFRPAITAFKDIRAQAEALMGVWILQQRKEERRLMDEAAAAAAVVLATAEAAAAVRADGAAVAGVSGAVIVAAHAAAAAATGTLVTQAAAAVPPKVAHVNHKPVWRWTVKDAASLPRAFLMADEKKIAAHVAKYGNKDVPSGVEVTEDVSFTVRS